MRISARLLLNFVLRRSRQTACSETSYLLGLLQSSTLPTESAAGRQGNVCAFAASAREPKRFIDVFSLTVQAGKGGSGCSTVWGSKAKGYFQPPDGGNGGPGGDVFVQACSRYASIGWFLSCVTRICRIRACFECAVNEP